MANRRRGAEIKLDDRDMKALDVLERLEPATPQAVGMAMGFDYIQAPGRLVYNLVRLRKAGLAKVLDPNKVDTVAEYELTADGEKALDEWRAAGSGANDEG